MIATIFVFLFSFLILYIYIIKSSFCFMHTARKKQRADYAAPLSILFFLFISLLFISLLFWRQ